jgi:hypothetical protein
MWSLWNNRNNIVFNHRTWLNLKQVWYLALLSAELEGSLQGQELGLGGQVYGCAEQNAQSPTGGDAALRCTSFG